MTRGKKEKRRVRERAEKGDMSYQAAFQQPLRDGGPADAQADKGSTYTAMGSTGDDAPTTETSDGTTGDPRLRAEPETATEFEWGPQLSRHLSLCLREFRLLLEMYMWIPQLYVDQGPNLLRMPLTFRDAPRVASDVCARVRQSRSTDPGAEQTERNAWESLPWQACLEKLARAREADRTNPWAVRLGRWGELAGELILGMPAVIDHPEPIIEALEIAGGMEDDGFVRLSTRKRYHAPIDDESVGIYHCFHCSVYREHLLVDADPEDPRFALQCWRCKYVIPGSHSTVFQRPGEPTRRTFDKPFIADRSFAIAHERLRDVGLWVGRDQPPPGAQLIRDDVPVDD